MTAFRFSPLQHVTIPMLECKGRVSRCIYDGSLQFIYAVDYVVNGECKHHEFYEDELDVISP